MSPLRQQMLSDMQLRGFSPRTQEACLAAIAGIAKCSRRPPGQLMPQEIEHYLLHLINERKLSWSTTNQATGALRFLFRTTLKQADAAFPIPHRKAGAKQDLFEYIEAFYNRKQAVRTRPEEHHCAEVSTRIQLGA